MEFIFKCAECGHNNTEEDIDYTNTICGESCGCEGYEYELICSSCGDKIYRGSGFGEFNRKEVAEDIQEEILEINERAASKG